MSSLLSSIFGGGTDDPSKGKDNTSNDKLTGLFESSKKLPERRVAKAEVATPKKKRTQRKRKDDDDDAAGDGAKEAKSEGKKRKKRRKVSDGDGAGDAKGGRERSDGDGDGDGADEDGSSSSSSSVDSSSSDDDSSDDDDGSKISGGKEEEGTKKKSRKTSSSEKAKVAPTPAAAGDANADDNDATSRTIFVGNLPPTTTRKSLAGIFRDCGKVESARLRSIAVEGVKLPPQKAGDQNLMRKVSVNTKKLDQTSTKKNLQGYVVFTSPKSIPAALSMNNTEIDGGAKGVKLRVDSCRPTNDSTKSVFVGNLPYGADESTLRAHFVNGCEMDEGDVLGVRIVRDSETLKCKGFGYVLLRERNLVGVALGMHGSTYMRREIRVLVCGKRFKGRRGEAGEKRGGGDGGAAAGPGGRRKFEGRRATTTAAATTTTTTTPYVAKGAARRVVGKMNRSKYPPPGAASGKKKRMRGATPSAKNSEYGMGHGARKKTAGVSKRAAAEAKVGKRVKKIQKRINKGMGKTK